MPSSVVTAQHYYIGILKKQKVPPVPRKIFSPPKQAGHNALFTYFSTFPSTSSPPWNLGGRVPYGYDRSDDPNHLPVINPETAPVVKHIFELRLQGLSQRKIADSLNEEQILCPSEYYYQRQGKDNPVNSRKSYQNLGAVETGSSTVTIMKSPSGFSINVSEHKK